MTTHRLEHHHAVSGWVFGFATLAGTLMILGGAFEFFQGLAAILNENFFVVVPNYIFKLDVTTWGWIHLILGAVVAVAGMYVFSGAAWARTVGIVLAILSAVANFFYIPYYPMWSFLIIAMDIAIIWALSAYGRDEAESIE